MADIPLYQIDAFTDRPMCGNPAAVCPLETWLADDVMQAIAAENNLSETVFFVPNGGGEADFDIRWFTPNMETNLCGHATLASAWAIFNILEPGRDAVTFSSQSGPLTVTRNGDDLTMDFPVWRPKPVTSPATPQPANLADAFGVPVVEVLAVERDYLFVLENADAVRNAAPDSNLLMQSDKFGNIITAPGDAPGIDFVSRFFSPKKGIPEDPVTGSAHCSLTPYWAGRLGKTVFSARQVSARGGAVQCELSGDRVLISGPAALYMQGTIRLP